MWMHQIRCSKTQEILGVYDKEEYNQNLEELRQTSKFYIEHMFKNNGEYSVEQCFKTISLE